MPLTPADLPTIAAALRSLIAVLQSPYDDAGSNPSYVVQQAGERLQALLMPSGILHGPEDHPDIMGGTIDVVAKFALEGLRQRLIRPFWANRAARQRSLEIEQLGQYLKAIDEAA